MNPSRRNCIGALALSPALLGAAHAAGPARTLTRSAATRGLFTVETAPDYASRLALAQPVRRLTDGAARGSDPSAAIHGNFARVIEQNFASAGPARVARWLDTVETRSLVTLAQAYINATEMKGRPPMALDILADRLDAVRLARLAEYFGHARLHAAVLKAAPSKLEAFNARADVNHRGPVPGQMDLHLHEPQRASAQGRDYSMFLDYTLEEVYLSFRTAPIGATSVAASMFQTGLVVGGALYGSLQVGYNIGGLLVQGMRVYTPSVWDSIVDSVQWWMELFTAPPPPPGSYPSPEEQLGLHQREGFTEVFNVDASVYDDFAMGGGDYESAYEWANSVPYEPYSPGGSFCARLEGCEGQQNRRGSQGGRRRP